jgi:hypothetical protein
MKKCDWHIGELFSPDSTIILVILDRPAFENITNIPINIAGKPFDLKDQISDEQYLTIEKNHYFFLYYIVCER